MRALLAVSAFAMVLLGPTVAHGDPEGGQAAAPESKARTRTPAKPAEQRASVFELTRYHDRITVVRERTPKKTSVTFLAEPKILDRGAIMLVEIHSVARTGVVPRWRCVAKVDIAECLGAPVRVHYLPADERIVLTATLLPSHLLAEITPAW